MTRDDYNYAKSIYDKMFWMQVFKPEEMKKAHKCLFGTEAANVQQARARVAAYFRYDVAPTFSDETISINNEGQSHQEDEIGMINEMDVIEEEVKPKRKRIKK